MARILLIDDDVLLRPALRQILEHFGHTVTEAGNGREGLAAFAQDGADLLITDILMPEVDGVEVLMAFRRMHAQVKIIAISGGGASSATEYLEVARLLGAAKVLVKPFTTDALMAAVTDLLPSNLAAKTA